MYILANHESARGVLWELQAHELLKKGYEYEENKSVCDNMEVGTRVGLLRSRAWAFAVPCSGVCCCTTASLPVFSPAENHRSVHGGRGPEGRARGAGAG